MGKNSEFLFLHLTHLIRSINDPEHPLTLEELNVVEQVRVQVSHSQVSEGSDLLGFSKVPLYFRGWSSLSSRIPGGIFVVGWRGLLCPF